MKNKIIIAILITVIVLFGAFLGLTRYGVEEGKGEGAGKIILTYSFEDPEVEEGFQEPYKLVMIPGGSGSYTDPGKPVMPFRTANILIPYRKEVQNIEVIPEQKTFFGKFYIQPGQETFPISFREGKFRKGKRGPTPPDPLIYNSTNPYPAKFFSEGSIQWKRGFQILILNLYPVEYIPKSREVFYFKSFKVIVKTRQAELKKGSLYRGLPEDKKLISTIVDNPKAVATYP